MIKEEPARAGFFLFKASKIILVNVNNLTLFLNGFYIIYEKTIKRSV